MSEPQVLRAVDVRSRVAPDVDRWPAVLGGPSIVAAAVAPWWGSPLDRLVASSPGATVVPLAVERPLVSLDYDNRWELPAREVAAWLAAELEIELDGNDGPDDAVVCVPASFMSRPGASRQLDLALRKLAAWRFHPDVIEWAKGAALPAGRKAPHSPERRDPRGRAGRAPKGDRHVQHEKGSQPASLDSLRGRQMKERSNAAIGTWSGVAQGTTVVLQQVTLLVTASLGLSPGGLAWLAPIGFLAPLVANGLTVFCDWVSARVVCLVAAAISMVGAAMMAVGGLLAARGELGWAFVLVVIGFITVPAALRLGELVVAQHTLEQDADDQVRHGGSLRTFLVLGIYLPLMVASVMTQFGWAWVFACYFLANLHGFMVLKRGLGPTVRHPNHRFWPYLRRFLAQFKDRQLLRAAAGACLIRTVVFAWVGGAAASLFRLAYPPFLVVLSACGGLLAVPLVGWRPLKRRPVGQGALAFAVGVPLAIVVTLGLGIALVGGRSWGTPGAWIYLACVVLGSGLAELAKQVGQLAMSYQATLGAPANIRFRRLGVTNLGGNLGQLVGASVGILAAMHSQWLWLLVLALATVLYGLVQARWLVIAER